MGIHDRDYYRESRPGHSLRGPSTVIGWLIVLNVAIYLVDSLVAGHQLSYFMAVHVGRAVESPGPGIAPDELMPVADGMGSTLRRPWMWWQLLTCGFAHAPTPAHIFGNMLVLFFLGRDVEVKYGPREFLRLYLTMLVVGSLVWSISSELIHKPGDPPQLLMGASGAVAGVVTLFALNFPHRTVLLMFLIPIPAWLLGVMFVVGDAFGLLGWTEETNVAFSVHLAGAAFALLYYRLGWNLTRLAPGGLSLGWLKPRPRLRVHDPGRGNGRRQLSEEVDRILEKIHRQGESSLTRKERRTLENASRQYQQRRQEDGDAD